MQIDLEPQDIETLLQSLKYSKQRISDAQGTPEEVRGENLERIEAVLTKLRELRRSQ